MSETTTQGLAPPAATRPLTLPAWVRGAATVMLGMSVVNAGNYAINLVFGRYLAPAAFGDVVFVTTGLLVLSAGASALQVATARGVAAAAPDVGAAAARLVVRRARQVAFLAGALAVVALAAGAQRLAQAFHLPSTGPLYWLGLLAPLHFMQGVQRGVLQGRNHLARLVVTFQAEMAARLAGSWAALVLGLGLDGVCAALFGSILASLLVGRWSNLRTSATPPPAAVGREFDRAFATALLAQVGLMTFAQADIFIVKSIATPEVAGAFAAVILLGRVVSFVTQAVSTPLLPIVVAKARAGEGTRGLLLGALATVAAAGLPLIAISFAFPAELIGALLGASHRAGADFLVAYMTATVVYACACVAVDYAFYCGLRRIGYATLALGLAKVVTASLFAHDVSTVIGLSVAYSAALLVVAVAAGLFGGRAPAADDRDRSVAEGA